MTIREFQNRIEAIYFDKDNARGVPGTFLWFAEEVGELARAIKSGSPDSRLEEFADVAAWLFSLASLNDVDMEAAIGKYSHGCPKCSQTPCACREIKGDGGEPPEAGASARGRLGG